MRTEKLNVADRLVAVMILVIATGDRTADEKLGLINGYVKKLRAERGETIDGHITFAAVVSETIDAEIKIIKSPADKLVAQLISLARIQYFASRKELLLELANLTPSSHEQLTQTLVFDCDCSHWKRLHTLSFDTQDAREQGWTCCPFCKKPFKTAGP